LSQSAEVALIWHRFHRFRCKTIHSLKWSSTIQIGECSKKCSVQRCIPVFRAFVLPSLLLFAFSADKLNVAWDDLEQLLYIINLVGEDGYQLCQLLRTSGLAFVSKVWSTKSTTKAAFNEHNPHTTQPLHCTIYNWIGNEIIKLIIKYAL
jgi:hypothetical protein